MNQSVQPLDRLVENYLAAVAYACDGLPAGQREDLVADLREHISVARAKLGQPTEAAIRTILDRLGEPAAIAAEAQLDEPMPVSRRCLSTLDSRTPRATPDLARPP